jgi:predicted MFS family arabinose efflux permease
MEPANPTPPLRPLTPRITAVLFVCALVAAASMHLYTPMLDVIARDFQASPAQIGCVPAASMLGFLAGVALLAPLGDIVDKRSLTLAQLAANVLILSVMASTGSLWVLIGGNFLVGMMASTSQHLVTMTAQLVPPERRGAAVGVVLSGMMSGILTGRLLGGFIAASLGWRAAFWNTACWPVNTASALPPFPPTSRCATASLPA